MAKLKYNANTFPLLAEGYARDGMIDVDIAKRLGISKDTFYKYILKFSDFSDALTRGKAPVDVRVENNMLKRSDGYDYEEVTTEKDGDGNITKTKTITKHMPPDVSASSFWLTHRKKDKWGKAVEDSIEDSLEDIANAIREQDTE
jgi:hypothetical protein